MKVSAKIISRCEVCRKSGKSGFSPCSHGKKRQNIVEYWLNGKRCRETVGIKRVDAEHRKSEIISQIHDGTFFKPNSTQTFNVLADRWLSEYAFRNVKPRTYSTYSGYINNRLKPNFGKLIVSTISQSDIETYLSKMISVEKLNEKTVNKVLKVLKTIFKFAKRWKFRNDNPVWDIENLREVHKEMDFFNTDEIRLLFENSPEPYKTLFATAILTGMRKSELLGLQWKDIDWEHDTIHVQRSLLWRIKKNLKEGDKRWGFDTPKSKASFRALLISPILKESLEIHKCVERRRLDPLKNGDAVINEDDLVFTNEVGNPIDAPNMTKRFFNTALEKAGLRKIRFHDLRHTFASLLIHQSENYKFIQSQLGHASIQTTIDKYGHLMPLKNYSAVGIKIDSNIFGVKKELVEATAIA